MSFIQKMKPAIRPLPPGSTFKDWDVLISTWFGVGLLRPAPGTLGSLAAIPVGYAIAYFGGFIALAIAAVLLFVIGTLAADRYGKKSGVKDDQCIVVDEVIGLWIAAIPAETNIHFWCAAFVLFRIFDIYKPWPASYFDKRAGSGFDVLMDDVVAGIYAMMGVALLAYSTLTAG